MQIGFIGLGAVVETAYLPALRRLGDVIDRCQGYDLDCSRALPGIQRCSSLSALLAEPLDTLFITTSSLQHLPVLERPTLSRPPGCGRCWRRLSRPRGCWLLTTGWREALR